MVRRAESNSRGSAHCDSVRVRLVVDAQWCLLPFGCAHDRCRVVDLPTPGRIGIGRGCAPRHHHRLQPGRGRLPAHVAGGAEGRLVVQRMHDLHGEAGRCRGPHDVGACPDAARHRRGAAQYPLSEADGGLRIRVRHGFEQACWQFHELLAATAGRHGVGLHVRCLHVLGVRSPGARGRVPLRVPLPVPRQRWRRHRPAWRRARDLTWRATR
mmetsp:Transcript_2856/g.8172  ORF Transcript_2856/g.8172 Transcript_2856/m.8172 type:complete len:212 (+) Transcript_2856:333-968(+)